MHQITTFSNKGLTLSKGNQPYSGIVEKSIEVYKDSLIDFNSDKEIEKVITGNKLLLSIKQVDFTPKLVNGAIRIEDETEVTIQVKYNAKKRLENLDVDIVLRASVMSGIDFFQANNKAFSQIIDFDNGEGVLDITIKDLHINGLKLYLFIAIFTENREECIFWWRNVPVKFSYKPFFSGMTTSKIDFNVSQVSLR